MLTIKNPKTWDWAGMPLSDCCEGNAQDVYFTLKLFNLIMEKMAYHDAKDLNEHILMPSVENFAEMEYNGMPVEPKELSFISRELSGDIMRLEDDLYSYSAVDKKDALNSTADLVSILYTKEDGFRLYPADKTAKGKPSVSAPTLKVLLDQIQEEVESRHTLK